MPERSSQLSHRRTLSRREFLCQVINLVSLWLGGAGLGGGGKVCGSSSTDSQPCRRYPFKREHMRLRLGVCPCSLSCPCCCCQLPVCVLPVSAFSCARRLPWLSAILKSTKILLVMAQDLATFLFSLRSRLLLPSRQTGNVKVSMIYVIRFDKMPAPQASPACQAEGLPARAGCPTKYCTWTKARLAKSVHVHTIT